MIHLSPGRFRFCAMCWYVGVSTWWKLEACIDRNVSALIGAGMLGRLFLLNEMQPSPVLFPHLLCRNNFATKVGKPYKFMLDSLQSFIPSPGSDLSIC